MADTTITHAVALDYWPTLEQALDIFAYHIGEIMIAPERVKVHFYGDVVGWYTFKRDNEHWAQCGNGSSDTAYDAAGCIMGNRVTARNDYTARCAPILAAIAARAAEPHCPHGERLDSDGNSIYCHKCAQH